MASLARVLVGAARAQLHITRQNIEDLRPLFGMPLVALIALGLLVHSGKTELAHYALVAAVLMTIGQMGNFVASEIVFQERNEQTLELVVGSPAPYHWVLLARVLVLTSVGVVGALEAWLIARPSVGRRRLEARARRCGSRRAPRAAPRDGRAQRFSQTSTTSSST